MTRRVLVLALLLCAVTPAASASAAVTITSPADGTTMYSPAEVRWSGTADSPWVGCSTDGSAPFAYVAVVAGTFTCSSTHPGVTSVYGERVLRAREHTAPGVGAGAAAAVRVTLVFVRAPSFGAPAPGGAVPTARPEFIGSGAPGAPLTMTIDGRPVEPSDTTVTSQGTWRWTPAEDLTEGVHTVVAATTSPDGSKRSSAERTFTVDLTAPTLEVIGEVGVSRLRVRTDAPSWTVRASDAGSGLRPLSCTLDGQSLAPCPVQDEVLGLSGLQDGSHVLRVEAIDQGGRFVAEVRRWTQDSTPPAIEALEAPAALTRSSAARFRLQTNETATLTCALDDAPYTPCGTVQELTGLADGAHVLRVKAEDDLGNATPASTDLRWVVDTAAPATTFARTPGRASSSTAPTFSWSAEDGAGSGVAGARCVLDGGAPQPCASPLELADLAAGEHTLVVRSRDVAGNEEAGGATWTWTVDTSAPAAPPAPGSTPSGPTAAPSLAFGPAEDGATFECRVDDGPWAPCTSPFTPAVQDGERRLEVRAVDAAGNRSPATGITVVADATPPVAPVVGAVDGAVTFAGEDGTTFECAVGDGPFTPCTSPFRPTGLPVGEHVVRVRSVDAAGNLGVIASSPVVVPAPAGTGTPAGGQPGGADGAAREPGGGAEPAPVAAVAPAPGPAAAPGAAPQLGVAGQTAAGGPDARRLRLLVGRTVRVRGRVLPVACRLDRGALRRCTVHALVRGRVVGRASVGFAGGTSGVVPVRFDARGLAYLRRSGGVQLHLRASVRTAAGAAVRTSRRVRATAVR